MSWVTRMYIVLHLITINLFTRITQSLLCHAGKLHGTTQYTRANVLLRTSPQRQSTAITEGLEGVGYFHYGHRHVSRLGLWGCCYARRPRFPRSITPQAKSAARTAEVRPLSTYLVMLSRLI